MGCGQTQRWSQDHLPQRDPPHAVEGTLSRGKSRDDKADSVDSVTLYILSGQTVYCKDIRHFRGFPGGASGEESTCQCRRSKKRGRDDPLEKETATHSSILAWRIPWTEKPGRLQSTGPQRVGHDWNDLAVAWDCRMKRDPGYLCKFQDIERETGKGEKKGEVNMSAINFEQYLISILLCGYSFSSFLLGSWQTP